MVWIKSESKNMIVQRHTNPQFKLDFRNGPVEVSDEVAKFLFNQDKDTFKKCGKPPKKERELTEKDKARIKDFTEDLKDDGKRNRSNKSKEEQQ